MPEVTEMGAELGLRETTADLSSSFTPSQPVYLITLTYLLSLYGIRQVFDFSEFRCDLAVGAFSIDLIATSASRFGCFRNHLALWPHLQPITDPAS